MDTNPRESPGLIQVLACKTDNGAGQDLEEAKSERRNDAKAKRSLQHTLLPTVMAPPADTTGPQVGRSQSLAWSTSS